MKNLLLEGYDLQADYLQQALRPLLNPHYRVAVIPFSFRDDRIRSAEDWDQLYGKEWGKYYAGLVEGFTFYGLKEENIRFVNYFTDTPASAAEKIAAADILYFTGGLPDRMLERLREYAVANPTEKSERIAQCLLSLRQGAPKTTYEALMAIYLFFMLCEHVDK